LQQFKQLWILEASPKTGKGFRDAGRYRFTLDNPKFQDAISEIHERLKLERDAERELRAQSRTPALPKPEPRNPEALYPGTSTLYSNCSVSKVHTSPGCSVKQETDAAPNGEKGPFFEYVGIDNKETCESAHYTLVKCEDEKRPDKKYQNISRARENAEEQSQISDGMHAENKPTCTIAHFSAVKCEENERSEVTPLVASQENENPPAQSCHVHGKATEWWKRADGDLVCNRCHPCPHEGQLIWETPGFTVKPESNPTLATWARAFG
jgi:hypothetical protein